MKYSIILATALATMGGIALAEETTGNGENPSAPGCEASIGSCENGGGANAGGEQSGENSGENGGEGGGENGGEGGGENGGEGGGENGGEGGGENGGEGGGA